MDSALSRAILRLWNEFCLIYFHNNSFELLITNQTHWITCLDPQFSRTFKSRYLWNRNSHDIFDRYVCIAMCDMHRINTERLPATIALASILQKAVHMPNHTQWSVRSFKGTPLLSTSAVVIENDSASLPVSDIHLLPNIPISVMELS